MTSAPGDLEARILFAKTDGWQPATQIQGSQFGQYFTLSASTRSWPGTIIR